MFDSGSKGKDRGGVGWAEVGVQSAGLSLGRPWDSALVLILGVSLSLFSLCHCFESRVKFQTERASQSCFAGEQSASPSGI